MDEWGLWGDGSLALVLRPAAGWTWAPLPLLATAIPCMYPTSADTVEIGRQLDCRAGYG